MITLERAPAAKCWLQDGLPLPFHHEAKAGDVLADFRRPALPRDQRPF